MNARRRKKSRGCAAMVAKGLASLCRAPHADLPRLRLPVPLHGRGRRALVPQPRRAAGGRGPRGHLPDAAPVASRRARRRSRACGWSRWARAWRCTPGRPAPHPAAARVRRGRARRTCCATAAATTSCTRRPFPTSRCWPPLPCAGSAASGSWSTGTSCGAATTGSSTSGAAAAGSAARCRALACASRSALLLLAPARRRLLASGFRGEVTVLEGEYAGAARAARSPSPPSRWWCSPAATSPRSACPRWCPAVAAARGRTRAALRDLRRRPERARVLAAIAAAGPRRRGRAAGFVAAGEVERALRRALCMVLPSRREGYGMVVIEAAAAGTPSVVVRGPGQRRDRARRGGRQRLRRRHGVARGPGGGDRAASTAAGRRCGVDRRAGSRQRAAALARVVARAGLAAYRSR